MRELIPNVLVEYAPQKRTIFSRCKQVEGYSGYSDTFFLQFPYMLFLKQHYLYCVFSDKSLTSESSCVCLPWMQNIYDLGRVCLRAPIGASFKDLINLFWNQIFNFDGPFGIPALLGMFGEPTLLKTLNDFQAIYRYDGIGLAISKALINWQNSSYDEIIRKMNDPIPEVVSEWRGSDKYKDHPAYQFRWKFSDWLDAVSKKHSYGPYCRDVNYKS